MRLHLVATVISLACWGAFGAVWLGGAFYNARSGSRTEARPRSPYDWLVPVVGALIVSRIVPQGVWQSVAVDRPWILVAGSALLVPATVFTIWARFALGSMWSSQPATKHDHSLRTDGPYAITRHPIYTGVLSMLVGTAAVNGFGRWLGFLVLAVVFFWGRIRTEEQLMLHVFGADYERYRQLVPMLVPGLRLPAGLRRR